MKNMLASAVEISKAWGRLMVSSAPLMERHWLTSMMPRGTESCAESATSMRWMRRA